MESLVTCEICKKRLKSVTNTHLKRHNVSFEYYKKLYPNSKIVTIDTLNKRRIKMLGRRHSEETKKKLSLVHKGKIIKEETRNKISKALKGRACTKERKQKLKDYYKTHNNHFKGKKHTLETRRKMSLAHMGKAPWNKGENWSGETKKKISDKLKGIKLTSETRKKMSLAHKGKTLSDITKKKISTFRKGRKMTLEHKNKMLESLNRSPNKFEKKYIDLFKQNNLPLEFVGGFYDRRFFIAGRVPDFVSTNGKKVIVEVFYDYFKIKQYGSVENYKKERIDTFSKYGWKTLFFTYKELESNFDECLEIIREELK